MARRSPDLPGTVAMGGIADAAREAAASELPVSIRCTALLTCPLTYAPPHPPLVRAAPLDSAKEAVALVLVEHIQHALQCHDAMTEALAGPSTDARPPQIRPHP